MDNIILLDENNNEVEFEIIDTFGVDDSNYAALKKLNEELILIVEVINQEEEILFKSIDDEQLLNEVIEFYEQIKREKDEYRTN